MGLVSAGEEKLYIIGFNPYVVTTLGRLVAGLSDRAYTDATMPSSGGDRINRRIQRAMIIEGSARLCVPQVIAADPAAMAHPRGYDAVSRLTKCTTLFVEQRPASVPVYETSGLALERDAPDREEHYRRWRGDADYSMVPRDAATYHTMATAILETIIHGESEPYKPELVTITARHLSGA